jgi:hypothetical protein
VISPLNRQRMFPGLSCAQVPCVGCTDYAFTQGQYVFSVPEALTDRVPTVVKVKCALEALMREPSQEAAY